MPSLKPRTAKLPMNTIEIMAHVANDALYLPMKLIFVFCSMLRDMAVVKVRLSHLSRLSWWSYTMRVMYTAVKNEQHKPMMNVVAKPRMGPVPNTKRITPVMIEVRLESKMAEKALV